MKTNLEIIERYTNTLSDFTFKELETDSGTQYAFCTGLHYYNIKNHLKNVNCLIAPDECVITGNMEFSDEEDRCEMVYFFKVVTQFDKNLNKLRDIGNDLLNSLKNLS